MDNLETSSLTFNWDSKGDRRGKKNPFRLKPLLRKVSSITSNVYFFWEAVGITVSTYIGNKMGGFGK